MIEGPENDDRYRMVEDELLSVAQRFTAHLHAAEYQRLQEASKSRNAKTIKDISRPVVGSMTDLVKRKQERRARAKKQRLARREALGSSSDDTSSESDYYKGTSLYGLMESPRKKAKRLDALIAISTTTRAAAGFEETSRRKSGTSGILSQLPFDKLSGSRPRKNVACAPVRDETTDEDDLDGPGPSTMSKSTQKPTSSREQPPQVQPSQGAAKSRATSTNEKLVAGEAVAPPPGKAGPNPSDLSDDTTGDYFSRLSNRQAILKNKRERRRTGTGNSTSAASNQDNIPGFL